MSQLKTLPDTEELQNLFNIFKGERSLVVMFIARLIVKKIALPKYIVPLLDINSQVLVDLFSYNRHHRSITDGNDGTENPLTPEGFKEFGQNVENIYPFLQQRIINRLETANLYDYPDDDADFDPGYLTIYTASDTLSTLITLFGYYNTKVANIILREDLYYGILVYLRAAKAGLNPDSNRLIDTVGPGALDYQGREDIMEYMSSIFDAFPELSLDLLPPQLISFYNKYAKEHAEENWQNRFIF